MYNCLCQHIRKGISDLVDDQMVNLTGSEHFCLQETGPLHGYFPDPTKSILVVCAHNLHIAKATFKDLCLKVTTSSLYLGGYMSLQANQELWAGEKVTFWLTVVTDLAFAALSHPQTV
jgi:hypothetical protein